MTNKEKKIVLAYADNDMLMSKTAESLFYHPNTIRYYLNKIKRKYGLDPCRFYDLVALVNSIKE